MQFLLSVIVTVSPLCRGPEGGLCEAVSLGGLEAARRESLVARGRLAV